MSVDVCGKFGQLGGLGILDNNTGSITVASGGGGNAAIAPPPPHTHTHLLSLCSVVLELK